jgi:hypothetical protein
MSEQPGLIRSRLGYRGIVWLLTIVATMVWVGWNGHPDDVLTLALAWVGGVATWALYSEWRLRTDPIAATSRDGTRHP